LSGQNPSTRQALQAAAQAQDSQDLNDETATVTDFTVDNKIETLEIDASSNCKINQGDSITFVVDGETNVAFATVVNGVNADITKDGDVITVYSLASDKPIEFLIESDNDTPKTRALDEADDLVVDSSTISCGNNNNNGHHKNNNNHNRRVRDFLRHNNPFSNQYGDQSDLEDAESDLDSLDGENSTLESDQYDGEDTLGNDSGNGSGVSANADENGAEASTPGAVASANADEDTLPPVSGPQGDVVDEVPTSGPLPNTGGVPVATGTVLALVLFGAGLLVVRLVMIWRGRRT
jgi:hypothetical protein